MGCEADYRIAFVQALVASPLKRPPSLHVMAQMVDVDEGGVVISRLTSPFYITFERNTILAGSCYDRRE